MHEDGSTRSLGDSAGHGCVPSKAADVIDDLNSGVEGGAGDDRFICVDGENGVWALALDGQNHRENAVEFILGGDRSGERRSIAHRGEHAGAGGFATDVENVSAFFEQFEAVLDGALRIEVQPTVRKGVRGDVEHTHDKGAIAEGEGAAADVPLEAGAHHKLAEGTACRNTRLGLAE